MPTRAPPRRPTLRRKQPRTPPLPADPPDLQFRNAYAATRVHSPTPATLPPPRSCDFIVGVPTPFPGFKPEALKFLKSLARNNDREWFQPRKAKFEELLRNPLIDLAS